MKQNAEALTQPAALGDIYSVFFESLIKIYFVKLFDYFLQIAAQNQELDDNLAGIKKLLLNTGGNGTIENFSPNKSAINEKDLKCKKK